VTYAGIIASQHETAERIPHDHYPTPQDALESIADSFHWQDAKSILDIGAGDGRWGLQFSYYCSSPYLAGVELRDTPKPAGFNDWYVMDYTQPLFRMQMTPNQFDLIVGNPPFKVAEQIISGAFEQLSPTGRMLMLLPSDFLHSVNRSRGLLTGRPPYRVIHIADRIDFTGSGNPHQYMSLLEWHNDCRQKVGMWYGQTWAWKANVRDWTGRDGGEM